MVHHSRDVAFREGKQYTAPNAADEVILNEHFYSDVIEEPKPTGKQCTRDDSSEPLSEKPLDNDLPPDSLNPMKKSPQLASLETSLGSAKKLPSKCSLQKCAGKDTLAVSSQLALEEEQLEYVIRIYTAGAICDDHVDGIDPKP